MWKGEAAKSAIWSPATNPAVTATVTLPPAKLAEASGSASGALINSPENSPVAAAFSV